MNNKYNYLVVLMFVFCQSICATQQIGDRLIVDETEFSVYMFRLSDELQASVDQELIKGSRKVTRSNNWDGFYADLKVRGDRLYLTSLSVDGLVDGNITKKAISLGDDEGLFASWFSGELRSVFFCEDRKIEQTIHFCFKNGVLVEKRFGATESENI